MPLFNILIITLFLFLIFFIFLLYKKISSLQNTKTDPLLIEWIKSMQQAVSTNSASITKTLQENTRQLNERLDKAAEVIRDVNREVGKVGEIGHNIEELQHLLKSPKLRGNIGEQVLKDLISQIFPKNSFHLQYAFKSGNKVDAIIKTDAGILPIDAKFPMENFQKMANSKVDEEKQEFKKKFLSDVKKHIDAIAEKYILPDENTLDFALMYVPNEAIFYEIANEGEITEYAKKNRVYIVSPVTLYAHLQTILLSFEGKKIEQHAKEIFQILRAIQIDYEKSNNTLDLLGKHLTNAGATYHNFTKDFNSIGNKLSATKQLEIKNI